MALPDPESLKVHSTSKCCANPELKKWLDDLKVIRDSGQKIQSHIVLSKIAKESGFDVGESTIAKHLRGDCGTS